MSIRIYLNNRNPSTSQIKIYRATSSIADDALPAPLVTLPGNATYYDDPTNLLYDVDYYYRVEIISVSGEKLLMPNQIKRLMVDTGPGPTSLIAGDETLGLFGIFAASDYPEISALFRNIPGFSGNTTRVIKYIRNGRISYTPARILTHNCAQITSNLWWRSTNSAPFTTLGAYRTATDPVQPLTIIDNLKFDFHVPKMYSDDAADKAPNLNVIAKGRCELADLVRVFTCSGVVSPRETVPFRYNANGSALITIGSCDNEQASAYMLGAQLTTSTNWTLISSAFLYNSGNLNTFLVAEYLGTV